MTEHKGRMTTRDYCSEEPRLAWLTRLMRKDWDKRAIEDVLHYIDWSYPRYSRDLTGVYEAGKNWAINLTGPAFKQLGFNPDGKRILDIGCGIGRFFPGFAELGFEEIYGIDISPEMIERGRRWCPTPRIRFVLGDGISLTSIGSDSVDYCFSYGALNGIPATEVLWLNFAEIHRVLKPGGTFQVLFRARHPLKRRILFLMPARIRSIIQAMYRLFALRRLRGSPIRPSFVGRLETWPGMAVSPRLVADRLRMHGFRDVDILPCTTSGEGVFWAIEIKP